MYILYIYINVPEFCDNDINIMNLNSIVTNEPALITIPTSSCSFKDFNSIFQVPGRKTPWLQ